MMPSAEAFAKAMGELGISDQQPLVIYDEGNLFSTPRAWWMLTHFGARQVAILSGGLAEWKAQGYPIEQGDVHPTPAHFNVVLIEGAIRSREQILAISRDGSAQIVDARPAPRFRGEVDEPRPGLRRGHIPGSLNVPWGDLVTQGTLKPSPELATILHKADLDFSRRLLPVAALASPP